MAIYSTDLYGSGSYGEQTYIDFDTSTFKATPTDSQHMILEWSKPGGAWTKFRLLRGFYGFAVNEEDGVLLGEWPSTDLDLQLIDYGQPQGAAGSTEYSLPAGAFVYYTIYVYSDAGVWQRAGKLTALVLGSHGYTDFLYNLLPDYWRERDEDTVTRFRDGLPNPNYKQPLYRFLKVFARQFEHIRTEYDSLLWLRDPDHINGNILPVLLHDFGSQGEGALSIKQSRVLARNVVHLRKVGGTVPGIEGLVNAYTGWAGTATTGANRLLDRVYTNWSNGTRSGELFIITTDANTTYDAKTATTPRLEGIPVTEATEYVWGFQSRAQVTAKNVTPLIEWYDKDGVLLSTSTGTALANAVTPTWTEHSLVATAPTGAIKAVGVIRVSDGASTVQEVQKAMFAPTSMVATYSDANYQTPRRVNVALTPDRVNLVPNPSFEVDTVGWVAGANTAIARSTAQFHTGTASLELAATAAGDVSATSSIGTSGMPVTAGVSYTLSAHLRGSVARDAIVRVRWYDSTGTALSDTASAATTLSTTGWTRIHVSGASPTGAAYAAAQAVVAAAAAPLTTPTGVTVTPVGTAGTTVYGYRVSAVNAHGETLASATVETTTGNATLDATNYNTVAWTAVTDATAYRVYGRTSGSELFMAEVTTTSFDDTGTVTPSGALPAANTTNEDHYLDAVLMEETPFLKDYFDANSASSNYLWNGTENNSKSLYYANLLVSEQLLIQRLREFLPLGRDFQLTYEEARTTNS